MTVAYRAVGDSGEYEWRYAFCPTDGVARNLVKGMNLADPEALAHVVEATR